MEKAFAAKADNIFPCHIELLIIIFQKFSVDFFIYNCTYRSTTYRGKALIKHSVILTVYNAPDDVVLCLQSIKKSFDFSCTELIIVDDASNEDTQKILKDFATENPGVTLVCHEKNQGYLYAINHGIEYAHGEIITLLNSDTYIPCDFTSRILACFAQDKKIGVASPVLSHGNPFSVPITFDMNRIVSDEEVPALAEEMDKKARNIVPLYPNIISCDGACFSFSRECLEKAGIFNEEYVPGYFEELDFCMRAQQKGFYCALIENLYIYHKSHASFGKKTWEFMKRNEICFYNEWGREYKQLAKIFPKKKHKKRVFCSFYSYWEYVFVESLLKIARFVPFRRIRRKIRNFYQ